MPRAGALVGSAAMPDPAARPPGSEPSPRRRSRREAIVANRAISVPTLTVKRFFQIDGMRKSMLLTFNLFICVIPLVIIAFGLLSRVRTSLSLGQVFVEQFHLKG